MLLRLRNIEAARFKPWFSPRASSDIMHINYGHVRHEREDVAREDMKFLIYIHFTCDYVVEKIADSISNFIELNQPNNIVSFIQKCLNYEIKEIFALLLNQ